MPLSSVHDQKTSCSRADAVTAFFVFARHGKLGGKICQQSERCYATLSERDTTGAGTQTPFQALFEVTEASWIGKPAIPEQLLDTAQRMLRAKRDTELICRW